MLDAKWCLTLAVIFSICHQCNTFLGITLERGDDAGTCYHDGETHQCTFFLFCAFSGGVSTGTCPGSLLYSCCVVPRRTQSMQRLPSQTSSNYLHSSGPDQRMLGREKGTCGLRVHKPSSRIVGGNSAEFGEFPWQAHIKIMHQQCGGVLLNHHFVLTAAHCVYRALLQDVLVVLGAYDLHDQRHQLLPAQRFRVVEKLLHPSFRFSPSHPDRYDVALIRLDRPARYQENVLPICLPPYGWTFRGWKAIITGWGKTDPALGDRYGTRLLQKAEVPIISNAECESWHRWKGINVRIFPEMLCAGFEGGKKDACVGDSGGPLIVYLKNRWTLVGIISAGFGCAQWRQPGIYHSVSSTVDWISSHIQ